MCVIFHSMNSCWYYVFITGTNHYLGTFDSEWDAAAVYAWAHWILYGKEATLKAQKEGEAATAAWEKEKKMISEGKSPTELVKIEKNEIKKPGRRPKHGDSSSKSTSNAMNSKIPKRILSSLAISKAPALLSSHELEDIPSLLKSASERLSR